MAKKRESAKAEDGVVLGSIYVTRQVSIQVGETPQTNEFVIEWSVLGLTEEPDEVTDISGNSKLFDSQRPALIDDDGLHLYFDPPLTGNTRYGFNFEFVYRSAAQAKSSDRNNEDEKKKQDDAKQKRDEAVKSERPEPKEEPRKREAA